MVEIVYDVALVISPTSTAFKDLEEITQGLIDLIKTSKNRFSLLYGCGTYFGGRGRCSAMQIYRSSFPEPAINSIETMYKYVEFKIVKNNIT